MTLTLLLALLATSSGQDPSKHEARLVTVDDGVRLEVLDWGGSGRPIVLLAGFGNTAHVFDEFAPKLTATGRVYGITRRGFGASSRPASGYDGQRLADDVLSVLDSLRIEAPVLVGHSMGGDELTALGNQHSRRLAGLVYLDGLMDPRDHPAADPAYRALARKLPGPPPGTPRPQEFVFPEAERRQVGGTAQSIGDAIGDGQRKRDYSGIRVPVLALFEFPNPPEAPLGPRDYPPRNDEERTAVAAFRTTTKAHVDRWVANLKRGVPDARVVDLPGAGHYVFLTREAEVLREIRAFVAGLPGTRLH